MHLLNDKVSARKKIVARLWNVFLKVLKKLGKVSCLLNADEIKAISARVEPLNELTNTINNPVAFSTEHQRAILNKKHLLQSLELSCFTKLHRQQEQR